MKTTIANLRKLLQQKFMEDLDRERRAQSGHELDDEGAGVTYGEDVDRVRRHMDGYGDDMEETTAPRLETNIDKSDDMPVPELEELSLMDAADPVSPEKARKILKHGHIHGKPLSKDQKSLFSMIAAGGQKQEPPKKKEK